MENKTSKYFKYAIGEIILVVIGILIALQINNWNEDRKDSLQEDRFYKAILLDLEKDASKLAYYEKFVTKRIEYLDTLLTYVRNPDKEMGIKKFGLYVEPIFYTEEATIYNATFESAKSAGTFGIVTNKNLLKDISEYYSDFSLLQNNFKSIERFVENQFEPMMYELPEGYIDKNTGDLVINQSDVKDFYEKIASIPDNRNITYDYQDIILHNPRMENYLIGDMGRSYNILGKVVKRKAKLMQLKESITNLD